MHLLRPLITFISFLLIIIGCTEKDRNPSVANNNDYPPELSQVLEAHGGIDEWNKQQTLSFELGNQKQTIDLHSREIKITAPGFSMGNDNGDVWLKEDSSNFQGSPRFYHSLMFYFHTMPFVFADDGLNYKKVPDKNINGTNYRGIKISFDAGVGDAPEDQYIMYYHPDTHTMEWLAYSSTYGSGKKSDNFNIIHYKTWKRTNGFLLPTELQWHEYNNGKVGQAKGNPKIFSNVLVRKEKMGADFYNMPKNAQIDSAGMN